MAGELEQTAQPELPVEIASEPIPAQLPDWSIQLQEARYLLNLSQQELSVKLGVVSTTVSRWERGLARPRAIYLQHLQELVEEAQHSGH